VNVPFPLLRYRMLRSNGIEAFYKRTGIVSAYSATDDFGAAEIWVEDNGAGIEESGNLFVPFFTTKPGGSGIGLVLSRQIAEAHGGSLTLDNRTDRRGCRAYLRLPV